MGKVKDTFVKSLRRLEESMMQCRRAPCESRQGGEAGRCSWEPQAAGSSEQMAGLVQPGLKGFSLEESQLEYCGLAGASQRSQPHLNLERSVLPGVVYMSGCHSHTSRVPV